MDTVANVFFVLLSLSIIVIMVLNRKPEISTDDFDFDVRNHAADEVANRRMATRGTTRLGADYHTPSMNAKDPNARDDSIYTPVVDSTNKETYKPSILDLIKQWAAQEDLK